MRLSILLVEDNITLASTIVDFFTAEGHVVDFAPSAELALKLLETQVFDIAILDLTLPGMNGLELCHIIKTQPVMTMPVLLLTARDSVDDIVTGFNSGADDYLTKPFAMEELYVRIIALSRRNALHQNHIIDLGPLVVDRRRHRLLREGVEVKCTRMGFNIVKILAEAYPRVVSRTELIQKLWGNDETESDSLRSHMYQLRNCLDKPFSFQILKTVHSVGFTLENITVNKA